MHSHLKNPFGTKPPGDPSMEAVFRKPAKDDMTGPEAIQGHERFNELVEQRKRDYLKWARDLDLDDGDPQQFLNETFTFNPDGTVEVQGVLDLAGTSLTRLPPALARVGEYVNLANNQLTSLSGFPQEVNGAIYLDGNQLTTLDGLPEKMHGDLYTASNPLTTLDGLRGKTIEGNLYLNDIPARFIPEGIQVTEAVYVSPGNVALKQDAEGKGYVVKFFDH